MQGTNRHHQKWAALALLISSVGLLGLTQTPSLAAGTPSAQGQHHHFVTKTHLGALNNSGVRGKARVKVDGRRVTVSVHARGLLRKAPHAMHFHFSKAATHRCPTVRNDTNADHRLNTTEGVPAYGQVTYSLTTKGNTGAKSALAVNRFPTANKGKINYQRTFKVTKAFTKKIRRGNVAVVIHGIDYNRNRTYDFTAGNSDLDPSLPTEATDPVACGILK